jgi:hypothetical protein
MEQSEALAAKAVKERANGLRVMYRRLAADDRDNTQTMERLAEVVELLEELATVVARGQSGSQRGQRQY